MKAATANHLLNLHLGVFKRPQDTWKSRLDMSTWNCSRVTLGLVAYVVR